MNTDNFMNRINISKCIISKLNFGKLTTSQLSAKMASGIDLPVSPSSLLFMGTGGHEGPCDVLKQDY